MLSSDTQQPWDTISVLRILLKATVAFLTQGVKTGGDQPGRSPTGTCPSSLFRRGGARELQASAAKHVPLALFFPAFHECSSQTLPGPPLAGMRSRLLPSSLLRLLVSALGDVMPRMPLMEYEEPAESVLTDDTCVTEPVDTAEGEGCRPVTKVLTGYTGLGTAASEGRVPAQGYPPSPSRKGIQAQNKRGMYWDPRQSKGAGDKRMGEGWMEHQHLWCWKDT